MKKRRQSLTKFQKDNLPLKVIGFDMDGVIIDHTKPKIRLAKKRGFTLKTNQTPSEVMKKKVPAPHYQIIQYYLNNHPKTALNASIMAKAKVGLERLKKAKIPYFLISRRRTPEVAVKLLKIRGLWPAYFSNRNAVFVSDATAKNLKAQELGVTHYVDDETKVIAELTSVKNKFLFDQHKVFKKSGEYTRVRSWPELLDHLLS
ncbi:MAG: hypothetical protein AAB432_00075 [Patescibacteria group bacterium]